MTKPGMRHPPKKKHASKPRPAVHVSLTAEQQRLKASSEFSKALLHLGEAELAASRGGTPNACIHSAYYAMHHCAIAVLLMKGGVDKYGDVPGSHEHVAQHFGKAVADLPPGLAELCLMLGRARSDRTDADYGLGFSASDADALATTVLARTFVDACQQFWMLAVPARSD